MSTELADIQNKLKQELGALKSTVSAPSGSQIKVANGQFILPDGKTSPNPIQAVVLGWRWINRYWPNRYDASKLESPVCYAIDAVPDNLVPLGGDDQQHTQCSDCPMNQYGSNGKGKACRNMARVAIAAPDTEEVLFIDAPPTSIKSFEDILHKFNQTAVHPLTAFIQIEIDRTVTYPKLKFSIVGVHDKNLVVLDELRTKADAIFNALDFEYDS